MTVRVLFVCLGNICRSPTAHGVFQQMLLDRNVQHRIVVDSAGTGAWHVGKAPDARATQAAMARGYDLTALRARQVCAEDFQQFDFVLAMDSSNLADLEALYQQTGCSGSAPVLFLERYLADGPERNVPDPYYGGEAGFEQVLDLVEAACEQLLNDILARQAGSCPS